ncbi:MAG TPA: PQQ-binding-like beta-propeller repeat protein [Methanomassiliicoccales archaeon]
MVSSRTLLKITLVIAALMVVSSVIVTSPIEAKSQSVQWTYQGGSNVIASYPALSPTGNLFVYSSDGTNATIYNISPEGKGLWNSVVALTSTPQFGPDGTLYVLVKVTANTNVNGTGLMALNTAGIMKWAYVIPGVSYSMKVLPDGGVVLGAKPMWSGQHNLICLNADGSERWTKGSYIANTSNPVSYPLAIRGNDVLVANTTFVGRSSITEYAPDGSSVRTFKTDFTPEFDVFFALDGTMRAVGYNFSRTTDYAYLYALSDNGSFMWAAQLNAQFEGMTILRDGTTVYAELAGSTGSNLNVYAVDANGKSLWRSVNAKTVPVAFQNGLLLANSTALMLVDRDGGVIWKLDGSFGGQPVVNGNTIYVGSGSILLAISESAWKMTWQPIVIIVVIMAAAFGVILLGGRSGQSNSV